MTRICITGDQWCRGRCVWCRARCREQKIAVIHWAGVILLVIVAIASVFA